MVYLKEFKKEINIAVKWWVDHIDVGSVKISNSIMENPLDSKSIKIFSLVLMENITESLEKHGACELTIDDGMADELLSNALKLSSINISRLPEYASMTIKKNEVCASESRDGFCISCSF